MHNLSTNPEQLARSVAPTPHSTLNIETIAVDLRQILSLSASNAC